MPTKIQQIIELFQKKFRKKKGTEEETLSNVFDEKSESKEPEDADMSNEKLEKTSMLAGDHGKIFGVSRPVVVGIGVFFFVVFSLAFIFASTDDSGSTKKDNKPAQTQEIANNKNNKSGSNLPNDYESLAKTDKNGRPQQGQNTGNKPGTVQAQHTTSQSTRPASETVATSDPSPRISTVPRASVVSAPYSQPYMLPSQAAAIGRQAAQAAAAEDAPKPATPVQKAEAAAKKVKDEFASAIAFALGGSSTETADASASGGSAPETAATPSTATSTVGYTPALDNTVTAGTVIPAMLMTGINTDAPGEVTAQILSDVYDYSGTNLLIPAGSQLIGKYDNSGGGTGRVPVTFSTLVSSADGSSWAIGNSMSAIDGSGFLGIPGDVHNHTARNLGKGLLNSAIQALGTIGVDRVTYDMSGAFNRLADDARPTTTVKPGTEFNIYVTQNIAF